MDGILSLDGSGKKGEGEVAAETEILRMKYGGCCYLTPIPALGRKGLFRVLRRPLPVQYPTGVLNSRRGGRGNYLKSIATRKK